MGKIRGLYRFKTSDINDHAKLAYCYVEENEYGNLEYHFTEDLSIIRKIFVRYAEDNGYTKADLNNIQDHKHFDLNCSSPKNVFDKIREANSDKNLSIEDFASSFVHSTVDPLNLNPSESAEAEEELELDIDDAEDLDDDFDDEEDLDEKDKFPTRVRKFFSNKLTTLKNKWNSLNPRTKVGFIGAGMAALSVAIAIGASVAVNKFGGPTATNSRVASVTDDNDKDKNKDQNDKKDEQETKDEDQKEKENEASKQNTDGSSQTSNDNSYSQASSNGNSNSGSGSSSNGGGS